MWRGAGGLLVVALGVVAVWAALSSGDEGEVVVASASTSTTTTSTPTTTTSTTVVTTTTVPTFSATISGVDEDRLGHSWREGCPVGPDQLSLISLVHWGFDGEVHQGELIVHSDHAEGVVTVFETLFEIGYPIESVITMGDLEPGAEWEPDYANTSGFNCRPAVGSSSWSEHARGLAIDINPHLNPYVRGDRVEPSGATRYLDRTLGEPGMITPGDEVVTAFESIGWHWGGYWRTLKDYHHFSATGR